MAKPRNPLDQIEFMRNLLAFLLVGAFISVFPVLTFFVIPDVNKDIVTYMVGQLSGMATTTLGFYFVNKVGQDAIDAQKSENTGKAFDAVKTALDAKGPSGTADDPVKTEVVNPPDKPANVTETDT